MVDYGPVAWTLLIVLLVALLWFANAYRQITVYEYQRALRYKNGRLLDVLGPGRHRYNRRGTYLQLVDIRETLLPLPGQEVVTADGVSVKLSLAVRTKLADPRLALTAVADYRSATYSIIQVALREVTGVMSIDDVLAKRDEIGLAVQQRSAEKVAAIGVELISVDVKDLMFPGPMKKLFAQVVEARQQGLASLERARAETAALRSLANAARMVDANPSLLQLRLLQQLQSASGTTLVVGMPSTSTPLPLRPVSTEPASTELSTGSSDPSDRE